MTFKVGDYIYGNLLDKNIPVLHYKITAVHDNGVVTTVNYLGLSPVRHTTIGWYKLNSKIEAKFKRNLPEWW
jgi:hypothetical protein